MKASTPASHDKYMRDTKRNNGGDAFLPVFRFDCPCGCYFYQPMPKYCASLTYRQVCPECGHIQSHKGRVGIKKVVADEFAAKGCMLPPPPKGTLVETKKWAI